MNINDFQIMREQNRKITMLTCYDYIMASIAANTNIDCLLVSDDVATVMHGYPTTVNATLPMMVMHTEAVARGAGNKFVIAAMPFLSYRKGLKATMDAVAALMQAGAHAIILERLEGNEQLIRHIVDSGVPVMGHLGLTQQSINQLGGHKVLGRTEDSAKALIEHAKGLQAAGCFAILLECISAQLAKEITEQITIPTLGLGAGVEVSGQLQDIWDVLGCYQALRPKYVKKYLEGTEEIQRALNKYDDDVKMAEFPTKDESFV